MSVPHAAVPLSWDSRSGVGRGYRISYYTMDASNLNNTTRKPQKRSCSELEQSATETSPWHFESWLIINSACNDVSPSTLSPFVVEKALKCSVGTVNTVKRLRSGDLLVEAVSSSHNRLISKLASLADLPVAVHAHRTLNKCKGVIKCRVLVDCYKVGILEELKLDLLKISTTSQLKVMMATEELQILYFRVSKI